MGACDKPVIKIEVDDNTNNQRHSDHDDDVMDTSDAANRQIDSAVLVRNKAFGIVRDLLQSSNRSKADEQLQLLEQNLPHLFQ